MKKYKSLKEKVFGLLEQANVPRYLHRFGPKTYEFGQHVLALFVKQEGKLSYRRTSSLLKGLGHEVPTYSALAKMNKRVPLALWQALLRASANVKKMVVAAMDAVFFSRTNPSYHYLKRIDSEMPVAKPVQATALVDTRTKKCVALRVRAKRRHDALDRFYLLKRSSVLPETLVADKAYDANDLHRFAKQNGFVTMIPVRKNIRKGFYRKYMKKFFRTRTYHRRVMVESKFSSVKRRSGGHVASRSARTQRAEIFTRFTTSNMDFLKKHKIFN